MARVPAGTHGIIALEAELERRTQIDRRPRVVVDDAGLGGFLLPGTIAAITAPAGSTTLAKLGDAIQRGDKRAVRRFADRYFSAADDIDSVGLTEASELITEMPSIGELSYGDEQLSTGLIHSPFLKDPVGIVYLPYTGGKLDKKAFRARHAVRDGAKPNDVLVVACPPQLNEVERAVLAQVPADESHRHIGAPPVRAAFVLWAAAITAAHVIVWAMVATAAVQVCFKDMDQRMDAIGLDEDQLAELGAGPAVDRLLALRREVLARGPRP